VALLAAASAASDAPYADLASAGIRKILDVLDPTTRQKADELAARIWLDTPPSSSRAVRSALEEAMLEQRVVRIRYVAEDGAATTRDVEPVMFGARSGRWYLIGWCRLRNGIRWFLVTRIERASVTTTACGDHTVAEVGVPPATARSVQSRSG
jgi:predicted DNA-binding transcriptional regulator YafY